jgi:C_GCAxxG_C_C family probable redox protein
MDSSNLLETLFRLRNGSNCAQAILSIYFCSLGYYQGLAHRIGAGLAGGLGRKQYICGAVNAGAIVLSAAYGNEDRTNTVRKDETMATVRAYIEEFEKEFRSSQCRELLGVDTNTPEGRRVAAEARLSETICLACITKVCALLDYSIGSRTHADKVFQPDDMK